MNILVTGAAGFIGSHLSLKLSQLGHNVFGIDNLNDYYDISLKQDRLKQFDAISNFHFEKLDICEYEKLYKLVKDNSIELIFHLAAQAGVRYSIDNPQSYQKSNIEGFLNILELCRNLGIKKLVYASSSSVYGNSNKEYFSETDNVDNPISLYASTKKTNELMAHTYSHLFGFQTIGLRFFTVYGPWGRPDMSYYKFLLSLKKNQPINVYNNGDLMRDFTYIDDIIDGIVSTINYNETNYEIFNLGNNLPVKLMDFISAIERIYGQTIAKEMVEMQDGDVYRTAANIQLAQSKLSFNPSFDIEKGLFIFINWFKSYYKC
jgi:UDP-glucuronate 4-epimerase